jgi:hypothetical protein
MLLQKEIPGAFVEQSTMLNSSLFLLNQIICHIQATSVRAYGLSEGKLYLLTIFPDHIKCKVAHYILGTIFSHILKQTRAFSG